MIIIKHFGIKYTRRGYYTNKQIIFSGDSHSIYFPNPSLTSRMWNKVNSISEVQLI